MITNEFKIKSVVESAVTNHFIGANYKNILSSKKDVYYKKKHLQGNINVNTETGKGIMIKKVRICKNYSFNFFSV